MPNEIIIGSVVKVTGDPTDTRMTVNRVYKNGRAECLYFIGRTLIRCKIDKQSLILEV